MDKPNTYIIAEAGVNHNGSLKQALQLIDVAKSSGADCVKFQIFKANELVCKHTLSAEYQKKNMQKNTSQLDMLKQLEISQEEFVLIENYCRDQHIDFMATPFDFSSLDFLLNELKAKRIKISSADLTNAPLLLAVAKSSCSMILSSGMASLAEIEQALSVLAFGFNQTGEQPSIEEFQQAYTSKAAQEKLRRRVSLLHCTSDYPARYNEVNLAVLQTLRQAFHLPVGLSDHTQGIAVPTAAVALGAKIVEKHFTLDKNLPGPDHKASLQPEELNTMVTAIRQVEEAMGTSLKWPSLAEQKNKQVVCKSLVAKSAIKKGELFSEVNMTTKRAGVGIAPIHYWDLIGKNAMQDYQADDLIKLFSQEAV